MADRQIQSDSDNQPDSFSWRAREYQQHQRGPAWYLAAASATAVLALLSYWLAAGDPVPPVAVVLMGTIFVGYALHPPAEQTYSVGPGGIRVGRQAYGFGRFQAFSLVKTGTGSSLYLPFNQRLVPPLTIPLPPEPGRAEEISRLLAEAVSYNPECQPHPIDRLMNYLRF